MGLVSISAVLKNKGHKVDLFDTTFIIDEPFEKIISRFKEKINNFEPDILLVGCRSLEASFTAKLLKSGNEKKIPVIIGGQHPTVSPERVINSEVVDFICVGEGEEAILELIEKLEKNEDETKINNIWAKKDGKIFRNPVRPLMKNLDELPFPDWNLFDARHVDTRGTFETSRGCPYSCTYCVNDYMQSLYGGVGGYHREKGISRTIEEMDQFLTNFPQVNDIWLIDETFTLKNDRVKDFCQQYKKRIKDKFNVPFGCMTRPEVLSEEKVRYLKEAGCKKIAMGIEIGNEKYRKEMLGRQMPQQSIINAFRLAKKAGIHTYSFNMVGFPNETRKDIFSTIDLNRKGEVDEIQCTIFYPFEGTRLKKFCEEHDILDKSGKAVASYYEMPTIKNPNMSKDEIQGLYRTFIIYVKSPKIFYPFIRLLESNNFVSSTLCGVINTFIKQGINFRTIQLLSEHLFKNVLKMHKIAVKN